MTEVPETSESTPFTISKRQLALLVLYFLLAVAVVVSMALYIHHQTSIDTAANSASHTTKPASNGSASTTNNSGSNSASSNSTTTTTPNNTACKHLTVALAQKILGSQAQYTTPASPAGLQAEDTSVSSCAYNAPGGSVQLSVRAALSSLGASQNATVFGSGRPSDSTSVQGYGQSAYWNPGDNTLNVLSKNDWYIITGTQPNQASAQSVADVLKVGQ